MSTLVLVRHGEPVDDMRGRCYGRLDVGLSERGLAEAMTVVDRLSDSYEVVYTSPRTRAIETAKPLADARGVPLRVDDRLREIDFGSFEGRTYEEIERTDPELFRTWMETPTLVRFPGGESFGDVRRRALAAYDEIRSGHGCAVVVSHGGGIRAGLAAWLGMPDEAIFRLGQRYCGVSIVDWVDETPVVRLVNG